MYQCKGCGGSIRFDIASQKLMCDFCKNTYEPEEIVKEKDAEVSEEMEVVIIRCPQCGGEVMSEDNDATGYCSFCGASTILDNRMGVVHRPQYIIPFKKTKEDCKTAYKKKMKGHIFAPSSIKNAAALESFKAIYMPYWSYYFKKNGRVVVPEKNKYDRGNYTYTDHYEVEADIDYEYRGLSHDASSGFADNLSEGIAPFDEREKKKFTPSYLSGYYAEINDISDETYKGECRDMVADAAMRSFMAGGGKKYSYDKGDAAGQFKTNNYESTLTMMPVWFLGSRVKDKGRERVAYSVMNGQTGRIVGDMPISMVKYVMYSLIMSAIVFAIMFFGLNKSYKPVDTMVMTDIMCLVMTVVYYVREGRIRKRLFGADDKGYMAVHEESEKEYKKINKMKNKQRPKEYQSRKTFVWIPLLVSMAVIFINPIEDYKYYLCAILCLIWFVLLILLTVSRFNMICSRELPQFSKKGGDDSAQD